MELDDNNLVNKLILLFVFDKMGMPITEKTFGSITWKVSNVSANL